MHEFEVNAEEGLDLVEEFYMDELLRSEEIQPESKAKRKAQIQSRRGFCTGYSARLCRGV